MFRLFGRAIFFRICPTKENGRFLKGGVGMRNINTMTKKEFLIEHLVYIVISFIWFKAMLFRSIGFWSRWESVLFFWGIILVFNGIGMAMTWKKRRNHLSLFSNVCIPLGIYTLITYAETYPALWITAFLVAAFLGFFYCSLICGQGTNRTHPVSGAVKRKRLYFCVLGTRTLFSFCLAALMVPLCIGVVFSNSLILSGVDPQAPHQGSEWTVANQMETVLNLREDTWEKLSSREKLDTLQTVANIEANDLGLPHELNVAVGTLGESTVASYVDADHSITINIDYFDRFSASEMLDTICHEAYHAYQHRLCDAYESVDAPYKNLSAFHNVTKYREEFANYTTGAVDYDRYHSQVCEQMARSYALDTVENYYEQLNRHLIPTGQAEDAAQ